MPFVVTWPVPAESIFDDGAPTGLTGANYMYTLPGTYSTRALAESAMLLYAVRYPGLIGKLEVSEVPQSER